MFNQQQYEVIENDVHKCSQWIYQVKNAIILNHTEHYKLHFDMI